MVDRTNVVVYSVDSGEVDVILLDNTRVKRIEIHNKDVFVPKTSPGFEHKTTFVLVFFAFASLGSVWIVVLGFDLGSGGLLAP